MFDVHYKCDAIMSLKGLYYPRRRESLVASIEFRVAKSEFRVAKNEFRPALATCETSQVLLAGVSGGFPGVLPIAPPTDWLVSICVK